MTADLSQFGLGDMLRCSLEVRQVARFSNNMEIAARRVCRYFYDELGAGDGSRACALVRCYVTQPYGALPAELQRFARRGLQDADLRGRGEADPAMKCLTLLATVGDEPGWNDRRSSRGHQAIPLASPELVQRAPMISQLIQEFGLSLADVISPSEGVMRGLQGKTYGVFHVGDAVGSPYIPAQERFVIPHRIRSVVGFGGSLSTGDLFAVILFSRAPIASGAADRFRTIALDVKSCFMPLSDGEIFDDRSSNASTESAQAS